MAIMGIGVDMVAIERMERLLVKQPARLAQKVLASEELCAFKGHPRPATFLAKRFAVKEAASKALGTGIAKGVTLKDFVVSYGEHGEPMLKLEGEAARVFSLRGGRFCHLSITDEGGFATAFVVLES